MSQTISPVRTHSALLVTSIMLVAASLRAPITALGPLIGSVSDSFDLSASQAGLLTTLPLIAFAIISPSAAHIARWFGVERALFGGLVLLIAGIMLRSAGTVSALYLGTCVIGGAIAVANVLLPSVLKRDFPEHVAKLTACYALAMITAGGVVSAVVVPLENALRAGWQATLGAVALLPIAAAVFWLPQLRFQALFSSKSSLGGQRASVWRSTLGWQVGAYLGLTCFIHFSAIAWLASILHEAGYSTERAGALHGWMQLAGAGPALLMVPLLHRMPDQRWVAFASPALSAGGLVGLLAMPSWAAFWVFAFGMGMGSALVLSLAFVGLRAGNQQIAASLSGMSQCIGYLMAAVGPTLVGSLHETSGNWTAPLLVCVGLCIAMSVLGMSIGRQDTIVK